MKLRVALLLLAAALAGCQSQEKKPAAAALAPATAPVATSLARPSVAAVAGSYEGSMGGKYPFRLSVRAEKTDSQLVGSYYYLSQNKPIALQGFVAPTGEIWLREYGDERPEPGFGSEFVPGQTRKEPFARFMVRRAPDGTLSGSWQEANSGRQLPVQLKPYRSGSYALKARVSERTYFREFTVPVFTVPDPVVTALLAELFGVEKLTGQTLAELKQEHHDHETEQTAQGYAGVESEVTYNDRGLLSVSLRDEYTGANVNSNFWAIVVDLRTGQELTDEIDPKRRPQFLAACEQQLQAQLREYLANEGVGLEDSIDVAGLRSQHIGPDNEPDDMRIDANVVSFNYPVQYGAMSNFMRKMYQQEFRLEFTFAEIKQFLRPDSPLRRL